MGLRHLVLLGAASGLLAACSAGSGTGASVQSPSPAPPSQAPPSQAPPSGVSPSPVTPSRPATASSAPSASSGPAATSVPSTLQSAFEEVQSGVVRFEVARCTGGAQGSGFQVGPDLVATAAHVVRDGQVVRVIQGTRATAGVVVGVDPGADVALVRTTGRLAGHAFSFAETSPRVGDAVAAIGFPAGDPISFNAGTVNGLGRKAVIEGIARHDLLELDAATTHGSSGGPVIRADGSVVGIVDAGPDGEQGRRLAVSSATAKALVDRWVAQPEPAQPGDCGSALDFEGEPVPADELPTSSARQALDTLSVYFRAVNGGDFATALSQLRHPGSLASFTAGVTSTQDSDLQAWSVQQEADRTVVWLTFTSRQDPGRGPAGRPQETCTDWSLDYVLAQQDGLWLIDGTRPHEGAASTPCAAPDEPSQGGTTPGG